LQQTAKTFIQLKPNERTDVIIIRGAPGSGKSQTAKSLSQFFPKGIRLEVDTIRQMVISVDWTNQQEHINMLQISTSLVDNFLKLGFSPVIVIDTFSGDKINRYLDILQEIDGSAAIKVFGLFTTDDELKRRLELRPKDQFKDFPICKKLNDDVLQIKCANEYQINTTGRSAMETAQIIYRQL
jgi:Cdc6-like AAA superfamily ATPase